MTLAARILALLANGRERTTHEIADRTGATLAAVTDALDRLRRDGSVTAARIPPYTVGYRLARPPAGRAAATRRLTAVPPPETATPATGQKMGVTR